MKTLILYYSLEGYTKKLAEALAEELGTDIERVLAVKEINPKGIRKFLWGGRQAMMGKTPAIEDLRSDFETYDLILVGSPVWAFTFAPPIKTVIEQGKLKGKKVAYFCTHEGGLGKTLDKFMDAVSKESTVIDSIDFLNDKKDILIHKEKAIEWAKKCMVEIE